MAKIFRNAFVYVLIVPISVPLTQVLQPEKALWLVSLHLLVPKPVKRVRMNVPSTTMLPAKHVRRNVAVAPKSVARPQNASNPFKAGGHRYTSMHGIAMASG